ncbi:hypothetical protein, partial [Clostridium perfringens]
DLASAGYDAETRDDLAEGLRSDTLTWPLADYRRALAALPEALRHDLAASWGEPEDDPALMDGMFRFAAVRAGRTLVAL